MAIDVGNQSKDNGFELKPVTIDDIPPVTIAITGGKGSGKSTLALAAPGVTKAFEFDRNTSKIWHEIYNSDPRIEVFNAYQYMQRQKPDEVIPDNQRIPRANKQFNWIMWSINELAKSGEVSNVVWDDGSSKLKWIAELVAKGKFKLDHKATTRNGAFWKDRNDNLASVHEASINTAQNYVIHCMYLRTEEITTDIGSGVINREVPNWVAVIMEETDVTLQCMKYYDHDSKKSRRHVLIRDSKEPKRWPEGLLLKNDSLDDAAAIMSGDLEKYKHLIEESAVAMDELKKRGAVTKAKQSEISGMYAK